MHVINLVEYSSASKIGDVDFDSFDVEHVEGALDEMIHYMPDEYGDDEGENIHQSITEINRIAHIKLILHRLPSSMKKKRFF